MKVIFRHSGSAGIEVSDAELPAINNALNEVCNALDISEFDSRMGCSRDLAKSSLKAVGDVHDNKPEEE